MKTTWEKVKARARKNNQPATTHFLLKELCNIIDENHERDKKISPYIQDMIDQIQADIKEGVKEHCKRATEKKKLTIHNIKSRTPPPPPGPRNNKGKGD